MNQIRKSFILLGFVIAFILMVFSITENYVFAIEFTNFTSEKYGIEFTIPNNWNINEKSRFDDGADISIRSPINERMNIVISSEHDEYNLQDFTEAGLELATRKSDKIYKIIEDPSIRTIDNIEIGTFLITQKDRSENNA